MSSLAEWIRRRRHIAGNTWGLAPFFPPPAALRGGEAYIYRNVYNLVPRSIGESGRGGLRALKFFGNDVEAGDLDGLESLQVKSPRPGSPGRCSDGCGRSGSSSCLWCRPGPRPAPYWLRSPASSASPSSPSATSPSGVPMSSSEEEEKARRKSEISWASDPSLLEARLADPSCISPKGGPPDARLYVDENALQSDEAMWAFYEQWCKIHGISRTRREMERRFKGFSEGAKAVHRASAVGERKWMNGFADMTKKEGSRLIGRLGPRRK